MAATELGHPVEPGLLEAAGRGRVLDDHHVGPEVAQPPPQGGIDGGIAHQHEGLAPQRALHGQGEAKGPRRRFDHDRPRLEPSGLAGPLEDVAGREKLHEGEGGSEQVGPEPDDPGELEGGRDAGSDPFSPRILFSLRIAQRILGSGGADSPWIMFSLGSADGVRRRPHRRKRSVR